MHIGHRLKCTIERVCETILLNLVARTHKLMLFRLLVVPPMHYTTWLYLCRFFLFASYSVWYWLWCRRRRRCYCCCVRCTHLHSHICLWALSLCCKYRCVYIIMHLAVLTNLSKQQSLLQHRNTLCENCSKLAYLSRFALCGAHNIVEAISKQLCNGVHCD